MFDDMWRYQISFTISPFYWGFPRYEYEPYTWFKIGVGPFCLTFDWSY